MQDFRKLIVWQRAQETCVQVYRFSADFPVEERYGLTKQLRDAAVSVGANLAEGSKRVSSADKARIFNISESESAESISLLDMAERLRYGQREEARRLGQVYDELLGMIEKLRQQVLGGHRS